VPRLTRHCTVRANWASRFLWVIRPSMLLWTRWFLWVPVASSTNGISKRLIGSFPLIRRTIICWGTPGTANSISTHSYDEVALRGLTACQRSTSAVSWLSKQQGRLLFNYLDDFIGVSSPSTANTDVQALGDLLVVARAPRICWKVLSACHCYRLFGCSIGHEQFHTVGKPRATL